MNKIQRKYNPRVQGCNTLSNYEILERIHEGTYGEVYKARDVQSGALKAVKKIKKETNFASGGISVVFLREINLIRSVAHPNIIKIDEIVVDSQSDIYIVMEFIPNELRHLNKHLGIRFDMPQVKCIMLQLLSGLAALHKRYIFHRDLKTSNVLYDHHGCIKICDFGLARHYHEEDKRYSGNVVTLWYRSPELLFGTTTYSCEIDMWSLGIIFAEIILNDVPFKADNEVLMLDSIIKALGTPDPLHWPKFQKIVKDKSLFLQPRKSDRVLFGQLRARGLSSDGLDLLTKMLCYNPKLRISAEDARKHSWFTEEPLPCRPSQMPKYDNVTRKNN